MSDRVDIQPATLDQVQRSDAGDLVAIESDVGHVAEDLREIDRSLRLSYDRAQKFFVVHRVVEQPDSSTEEQLVTTSQTCDQRLVRRVREISAPGYDYVAELDRLDREAERRHDHEMSERTGPLLERLAHAMSKDVDWGNSGATRTFVPDVPRGT